MEDFHDRQLALQAKIANYFHNFKSKGKTNMNKGNAESRLEGLERNYIAFQVNHEKILKLENLDKTHAYFSTFLYDPVEDSFYDRKGEFLNFLEGLKANTAAVTASNSNAVTLTPSSAQTTNVSLQSLPKLDLPKFFGKFSDWENFRDVFRAVIHRREPVMKLHYLRTHLSLPISGDNYERAWITLTEYYENQRRIVSSHISEISSVKPMKMDSSSEIKRIYRELYNPIASLASLNRADSLESDLMVHFTLKQLDLNKRKEWERHLGDSVVPPTMEQLQAFLRSQTLTLEAIEAGSRSSSNNNPKTQSPNPKSRKSEHDNAQSVYSHQTSSSTSSKKKCSFCNQSHFTNRCERFLNKSIPERKELIKSSNLCFNCLGKHNVKSCTSTYRCFLCKAKHHTMVHTDSSQAISSLPTDQINSVSRTSSQNCGKFVISNDFQYALQAVSPNSGESTKYTGVLLATARVNALGPNGTKIQVRALIDPGSQIPLVTQALCNLLSLNCRTSHTHIQGIGENTAAVSSKVASLSIQPHFDSTYSLEVDSIVLPKLSSYKPPVVGGISNFEYLAGLQLADPAYLEPSRIDILLGASAYAQIIENQIVKGQSLQPIALSSKLGWHLTGSLLQLQK